MSPLPSEPECGGPAALQRADTATPWASRVLLGTVAEPGFIFPVPAKLKLTSLTFRHFNTVSELVYNQLLVHLLMKYLSASRALYGVCMRDSDELEEFES